MISKYNFFRDHKKEEIERNLDSRFVKFATSNSYRRYPDGYVYREAIRFAITEKGDKFLICIHGFHYPYWQETNQIMSNRWKEIKAKLKGKTVREFIAMLEEKERKEKEVEVNESVNEPSFATFDRF